MKKKSIKSHLSKYSIRRKRSTTINHAFASAIAPYAPYDEVQIAEALRFLGQDPDGDLACVYCAGPARTWDHLMSLVKDKELQGYGHQLGNLVPSCKDCNSSKGAKDFSFFIRSSPRISSDRTTLIELLIEYSTRFAKPIDLQLLQNRVPEEWRRYSEIKMEIFRLMEEADAIADVLRKEIVK